MECAGYSDRGGREFNEDACKAWGNDRLLCAVVADGLGGHGGGELASRIVIETVDERMRHGGQRLPADETLCRLAERMNRRVLNRQTENCKMKSTMVFLHIDKENGQAKWMHLGDSRLYHFVDGKVLFYTFDHSVSRMLAQRGDITIEQVRFHEDRNRILKAVGGSSAPRPEIGACGLDDGMRHVFLLCTDGFWEYVTEDVMERTLAASKTPKQWIGRMRVSLAAAARAGNDNHSAIAIWL